ncbi:MAG TPA: hypothetical protein VFC42_16055 [Methylomirabilota bacterium]|nr:hypothetical protein [Methylomirabilota bacterium]
MREGGGTRGTPRSARARVCALAARAAGATLVALCVATMAPGGPGPAGAEGVQRYSGRVTGVDLGRGLVVVEELGRRGRPVRHEVLVEDATPLVSASRLKPWDARGWSGYGETPVSLADVLVGDFVVVESVELEGQSVARRITIVETRKTP